MKKNIIKVFLGLSCTIALGIKTVNAYATGTAITVSPMHQTLTLVPGMTEEASFMVSNPADSPEDLNYRLDIRPFFMGKDNQVTFTAEEDYSLIVDWIKLGKTSGTIKPGEKETIIFTIETPDNPPAGGQYASIVVQGVSSSDPASLVNNNFEVTHLIYAEVAGETKREGNIAEANVPGLMLSGSIKGNALIENKGNVHAYAKQTLKVLPLFGDEEYFTNEDEPKEVFLMPEASQYTSVDWDKTPSIGIFRVEYIVEFEGVSTKVEKIVIICPLWLLIIIFLFIVVAIYRFITDLNKKKPAAKPAEA